MGASVFIDNAKTGQHRRTSRCRPVAAVDPAPLHDAGHVPDRNRHLRAGRAVLVQGEEIPAGNRAMRTGTVAALSKLPPGIFQFHFPDIPVILSDRNYIIFIQWNRRRIDGIDPELFWESHHNLNLLSRVCHNYITLSLSEPFNLSSIIATTQSPRPLQRKPP